MHITSNTLLTWVRDYTGEAPSKAATSNSAAKPSSVDALIPRDATGARDRGALRFAIELGARELGVKVDLDSPKAGDALAAAFASIKSRSSKAALFHGATVEELAAHGLSQLDNEAVLAKTLVQFVRTGYLGSARALITTFADWFEPNGGDVNAAARLCLKAGKPVLATHTDVQALQAAGLIDGETAALVLKQAYLDALRHVGQGPGGPDRLAYRQELVASLEPHVTIPLTTEERDSVEKSAAAGTLKHAMSHAERLDASIAFVAARAHLFDAATLSRLYGEAAARNLEYGQIGVYTRVRDAALAAGCATIDADIALAAASVKADLFEALTGERAPFNRNMSRDFKRIEALLHVGLIDRAELTTLLQQTVDITANPSFEYHYNDADTLVAQSKVLAAAHGIELQMPRWRGR